MEAKLIFKYDREADILHIDKCPPYPEQSSEELGDDVIARLNPTTRQIENVEVLFFSTRLLRGDLFELPVTADWSPGVYITATAFRPAENPSQRGPGRAIGVTWLGLDPQPRTLQISLEVPKELTPRQLFELPVAVTGSEPGKPAWLTLAAVALTKGQQEWLHAKVNHAEDNAGSIISVDGR